MKFETCTLDNGLRVICTSGTSNIVYCGIAVDAGTRDELPEERGIAHFTEHMSFKGTTHRSSWNVINRMESVGGDLNAYTGKEETVYYCAVPLKHYARAIDLLLDITLCSTYPQREMDKEVEVVVDEIESYNDSPSELIYDDYDSLIFPDHPLGRSILGDAERLRKLTSDDMRRYAERLYRPERMVLYLYGNVPMKSLISTVNRKMPSVSPVPNVQTSLRLPPQSGQQRGMHKTRKDTHQAHVLLGKRSYGAAHPDYLHLYLLSNILGGAGMNSRLNVALRERNGLVYTVESNNVSYTDTGVWNVYFGCDSHDVERCLRLVQCELQRLTDAPLTERALNAAKRQLKGQMAISYDNHESLAIGMGKRLLHYGTTLSDLQLYDRIDAINSRDLWRVACEMFSTEELTTLVYE